MARLDEERQVRVEPKRIDFSIEQLSELGLEIIDINHSRIDFIFKGSVIQFYP
jgi:hypothetical protein